MTTGTDEEIRVSPHPAMVGAYEWTAAFRAYPKSKSFTAGVVAVAYALASWAAKRDGTEARPSQTSLSTAAGVGRKKVGEALAVLEAQGWIERTGTHHTGVKVYRLSVPGYLPLLYPELAAVAKVKPLTATSSDEVRRQDSPPASEDATLGESSGRRGCVERTQGVSPQDARGASSARTTSSRTSVATSSPTSSISEPAPWTGDPWAGVVVAGGPITGAGCPPAPLPEPQPVTDGDPWEGVVVAGGPITRAR